MPLMVCGELSHHTANSSIDTMAKVNLAISAAENVLALVNAANPSLNATLSQVTLGNPSTAAGTGGRNTSITFTAIADQGFSGSQTFSYTRQALAAGQAIATAKDLPVTIAQGDSDAQILTKAATALGLLESQIQIGNVVQPTDESTPGSADITPIANSLLYTGSYEVILALPDADVPLNEAASTTDLDGFEPEA